MEQTTDKSRSDRNVVIIGGGPAGLTAAYELTKFNQRPIVLEKSDKVGGLARTENYKGFYFDMGGPSGYGPPRAGNKQNRGSPWPAWLFR